MKIENIVKKHQVETEEKIAQYSVKDIENLIIKDLKEQGLKASEVNFKTDYKYVSDDWGMNTHIRTTFNGATTTVKQ